MTAQEDIGVRQKHHYYFKNGTMDFAAGWLLGYIQIGGLSVGEIYDRLNKVRDDQPESWVKAFTEGMDYEEEAAQRCEGAGNLSGAATTY